MSGIQENQMLESAQNAIVLIGTRKERKKEYDRKRHAKYRLTHREELCNKSKEYRLTHKGEWDDYFKQYRLKNKDKIKKRTLKYNLEHRDNKKKYHLENKEKMVKYRLENIEKIKEQTHNYRLNHKEECNARARKYCKNPTGKLIMAIHHAKRKRSLGYNTLNAWFEGADGHHIGREYVIYIPKELHQSISHSVLQNRNMKAINAVALDYLFTSATQ